jgi:hypothetical protein
MRLPVGTRAWVVLELAVFVLIATWQARADLVTSDTFGVRSNTNPSSLKPNFHEYNGTLVNERHHKGNLGRL